MMSQNYAFAVIKKRTLCLWIVLKAKKKRTAMLALFRVERKWKQWLKSYLVRVCVKLKEKNVRNASLVQGQQHFWCQAQQICCRCYLKYVESEVNSKRECKYYRNVQKCALLMASTAWVWFVNMAAVLTGTEGRAVPTTPMSLLCRKNEINLSSLWASSSGSLASLATFTSETFPKKTGGTSAGRPVWGMGRGGGVREGGPWGVCASAGPALTV